MQKKNQEKNMDKNIRNMDIGPARAPVRIVSASAISEKKVRTESSFQAPTNSRLWDFGKAGLIVAISVLAIFTIVKAGSLTPPSPPTSPAATSYTLDDIYTRLTTNAAATQPTHTLSTSTAPVATFHSLSDIYNAIPTISAGKVAVGTTYLGVAGTLLGNEFNGTGQGITGGSQANGGADDYNNGGSAASSRYATTWTTCTLDNNYCGTGFSGAAARDEATGLIWSHPCKDVGCSSWETDTSTLTKYSWGGLSDYDEDWNVLDPPIPTVNNGGKTASQLCSQYSGWYLPHQKQLMQAYIDGSYGNLEPLGVVRNYWSTTTLSYNPTIAWYAGLSNGYSSNFYKAGPFGYAVRCVRSAN